MSLARECRRAAGSHLSAVDQERLGDLARDYLPSRYPDALPEGMPRDHYGSSSSMRATETAAALLAAVESCWAGSQDAADESGEQRDDGR